MSLGGCTYLYVNWVTRNIPTRNMPTEKLTTKKMRKANQYFTRTTGTKLIIPTRAKRAKNWNNETTQEQNYFFVGIFLVGIFHRTVNWTLTITWTNFKLLKIVYDIILIFSHLTSLTYTFFTIPIIGIKNKITALLRHIF